MSSQVLNAEGMQSPEEYLNLQIESYKVELEYEMEEKWYVWRL
jgi:hypothetical protein